MNVTKTEYTNFKNNYISFANGNKKSRNFASGINFKATDNKIECPTDDVSKESSNNLIMEDLKEIMPFIIFIAPLAIMGIAIFQINKLNRFVKNMYNKLEVSIRERMRK